MNPNSNIIFGQPQKFDISDRYFLQTAESAMKGDIIRGLVELITNADDSYEEVESKGQASSGKILIEIIRKKQRKNSLIKVVDKAEGMKLEEMVIKLKRVGGITSHFIESKGLKTRGLMGRGSKECVVFGPLTFKSIKDNVYSEVVLKRPAIFIPQIERPVTEVDRVKLDIKGNGTIVELEVEPHFQIPSHNSLVENLPKYYSLRDITSNPKRIIELSDGKRSDRLVYNPKKGAVILDEVINIVEYPDAQPHLVLTKTSESIEVESNSPFWEGGILIQSGHAVHGVTGFTRDIENNPYFVHYFGRLVCPYIDILAIEYEKDEKNNQPHTALNPSRIIEPLRKEGLSPNHPFTKILYREASRRIKILLKKDEELSTSMIKEIENKKTKDRLKRLADAVSKFIKERTEDLEIDDDNYLSSSDIPVGGMIVIPGGLRVSIGEERRFYVYVKPKIEQDKFVTLFTKSSAIALSSKKEDLIERNDGTFYAPFSVKGIDYVNDAVIKVNWSSIVNNVPVSVIKKEEDHPFITDFSFEKNKYNLREGKQKDIYLLAKWPDFVHGWAECTIVTNKNEFITVLGNKTRLKYKQFNDGTQMAIGKVRIYGVKTGGPTIIKASLNNKTVQSEINVLPKLELGHNIEIKLVDEEAGAQRAVWDGDILKINTRHKTIRRYSGSPPDYLGQDSIHFHLLLAELIADNVARRVLELNAEKNIHKYQDMDIYGFYDIHRKYVNDFLEVAHTIQIPDNELVNIVLNS